MTAENTNEAEETLLSDTQEVETEEVETTGEENGEEAGSDKETEVESFDASKVALPEGFENLDEGLMTEFSEFAKEKGISQEVGQKFVDLHAQAVKGIQESAQKAHAEQVSQWAKEAQSDKEIGGDKFKENLSVAKSAMAKFGSEELKEFLNTTGLGNHPEMIRLFHKVGKAISEDTPITGKPDTGQKKSVEERLYGG